MKKIIHLFIMVMVLLASASSITLAQGVVKEGDEWITNTSNPVDLLNRVKYLANDDKGNEVQVTPLNNVSGNSSAARSYCDIDVLDKRFTITKTVCSIKHWIRDYLQYVMYIGLAAATIFIIWNGFLIVTSSDREKQMGVFKKNMINLIIGVVLITSFYFILDVFVSVVNFIAGD